ncbi:hypothetical protein QBC38DRAFT_459718 [Podospora fimiseda]|uniref:Uncharacterized protein n=1 Tax=Podospora fimiseda TaxID=252190 RepID=A0AAN7BGW9_9PEZI|nr:hypothetical protein QBC38DRAFT_459718 [Podospora fimiseda]
MTLYDIGETVVYRGIDGDDALAIVRDRGDVIDQLGEGSVTLYEIEDVESGETFTVVETRILGLEDDSFEGF